VDDPPRLPRFPARPASADQYTWLGVMMLGAFAVGFFALLTIVLPVLNWRVLLGLIAVVTMGVMGHWMMGRWVARVIAQSEEADALEARLSESRESD